MNEYLLGTNGRRLLVAYGWLLILFIVVPALVLVPVSIGKDDSFVIIPRELSLRWYETLFADSRWRDALVLSLKLAAFASVLATVTGVLAAIGISRASPKVAKALRLLFIAPIIVPLMVIGVGFYVLYARMRLLGGFVPLGAAHAVLVLPFVMLPVSARLYSIDHRLEWAAASLGAGPYRTIVKVILPLLMPAILAGFVFAFIFSFDEVVIAQFLSGPQMETLPRRMWEGIQMGGLDKTITAVTTVQLIVAVLAMLFLTMWQRRAKTRNVAAPDKADEFMSSATVLQSRPSAAAPHAAGRPASGKPVGTAGVGVRFEHLAKRYNDFYAVDGLNLDVAPGEFLSILGPSGSGKTTVLMLIAGFVSPSSGKLLLGEQDISQIPPHKRNIGVVFQNYALFPHLDVKSNVAFPLQVRGLAKDEIARRVNWALQRVHMSQYADRRISQLSGGQQQRVALARAIVFEPRALLMDEPLAALDRNLRADMQHEIRSLQRSLGQTVIYVTHDQEEALNLSDRVAVMDHGRLQQVDTPKNLYLRPANPFVAGFFGEANLIRGHAEAGVFTSQGGVRLPVAGRARGAAVLCVRPEMIVFDGQKADSPLLEGSVVETRFQGSILRIALQTPLGPITAVRHINTTNEAPAEGTKLPFGWNTELGHLMVQD
ncbi:ATP-binding cassette domain-containing protein [Mesorhizobium sp. LHD-90]|uniref:ATP-binding cassette domain-containing protein n=1 Tax=Mesorhizobium sp. LHD-90 TaxID=3071414 RepID=UPI0027E0A869|nr:ATP-binding cassette domain-containing protein [Mesorhizobium sp. LHD-90]MDQ6432530.1 ATP-binding cassette domain-containing protein [Mesorhizobium sp. LHD-90]